MKMSRELLKRAGIKQRLRLGVKTKTGVVSNGAHKVKLISDEVVEKLDFTGAKRKYMRYTVLEDAVEKYYDVKMFDENKQPHYLIQRLAEIEEGATVVIELKKHGLKNYVEVTPVVGETIVAEVDEDDDHEIEEAEAEYETEE